MVCPRKYASYICITRLIKEDYQAMRNPFKKSNNKTPEGEPLEHIGDLVPSSKKLVIIATMVTFIIIISSLVYIVFYEDEDVYTFY